MAQSKFSLDGPAFEDPRQIMQPDHVMPLQEEAGVHTPIFQTPPGLPTPQQPTGDTPENSVIQCIMADPRNDLHAFQEYERYFLGVNSESDCDVPEDTDEMEDISSGEDQLVPVNSQEADGAFNY